MQWNEIHTKDNNFGTDRKDKSEYWKKWEKIVKGNQVEDKREWSSG